MNDNASHPRSDWFGGFIGILTFLAGIALLFLTFKLAFDLFSVRPEDALGVDRRNPVDLARTGESFVQVVGRVLFLLVMSAVASVIANRGIRLYAESRGPGHKPPRRPARDSESPVEAAAPQG